MNFLELLRNKIAELESTRAAAVERLEVIAARVARTNRSATPTEDAEVTALDAEARAAHAEIVELKADLAEREAIDRARKTAPKAPPFGMPGHAEGGGHRRRGEGRSAHYDHAMRSIESDRLTPSHALDVAVELVERGVSDDWPSENADRAARWVAAAGNPDYLSAFGKLLGDPARGHLRWTPAEQEAFTAADDVKRSMSLTDAAGGFMVPLTLDPAIMLSNAGANDPMRQACRVVTTVTDSWAGVTSAGVTAAWGAEASEVADGTPVLEDATIAVHRGHAFVPFSIEIQGDAGGLVAELRTALADAKELLEAPAFATGTGVGQPQGFVTALAGTASEVASTAADVFATADVYKLLNSVAPRFRADAAFQMPLEVILLTRQFATGTGPQSAFWADFGDDTPPRLIGKPVFENSSMDGVINAAQNNFIAACGDWKRGYVIVDRVGTTIELVPHLFGANRRPTGERGLYMYFRTGAGVVVPNALRLLNV